MRIEELRRLLPATGVVLFVVEAGETEKLVGPGSVVGQGEADRLSVRGPGQTVDQLDVMAQGRPGGVAVVAGQGKLRVRELEGDSRA